MRVLGIAESFVMEYEKSVLAGIVMRSDFIIDGVAFSEITVGGMDATEGILQLFRSLQRGDINAMMLNGCVISWFNIVNLEELYEKLQIPLVCVTYEESEGLEGHIEHHFKDRERDLRLEAYRRLGNRTKFTLSNKYEVLIRFLGMDTAEVKAILNKFTLHGRVPEPLRIAKMTARATLRYLYPA
ncbi:MAG: DUF99 family protein [Methanophagales archaeon]|nr:DUF99 family protein [Methanophagales archaeon]